jgi:4a-hydroxytetrahydrobiopterin dehydratase
LGSLWSILTAMVTTISPDEARARLQDLTGWELGDNAIRRQFTFGGFAEAVSFVVRLGFAAEAADHHPDILINYKRVTLTYSTHSAGGLTEKDFAGAREAERLAAVS